MNLDPEILEVTYTNEGDDLKTLSEQQPIFLVFLRHFGCTFCREALSDIANIRETLEAKGLKLVLVHMASEEVALAHFENYQLNNVTHISDPDLSLYEYFGLFQGKFHQLYGLKVWLRGLKVGIIDGHGGPTVKKELGSVNQMPGIFLLENGDIKVKFIHKVSSVRPNYMKIVDDYLGIK